MSELSPVACNVGFNHRQQKHTNAAAELLVGSNLCFGLMHWDVFNQWTRFFKINS